VNAKLKTLLKVAVIVAVPGAAIYLIAKKILEDVAERQEFREYVRRTYGEGSKYEHANRNQ
jgi:hypothetical protein